MATPPREERSTNDDPMNTGTVRKDWDEFPEDFSENDDSLDNSGVEASMDLDTNIDDAVAASAFDASYTNCSGGMAFMDVPETFPDFEYQDNTKADSEIDPFGTELMNDSAAIDSFKGEILSTSNQDTTMATFTTEPPGTESVGARAAIDSIESDIISASIPSDFDQDKERPRDKKKHRVNKPPPADAEIIDLDARPDNGIYIKSEDGDVTFIKGEKGACYPASGFIIRPNSKDEPICLDDDDDDDVQPHPRKDQPICLDDDKKSASPLLEDTPMQDVLAPDADAASDELQANQHILVEADPDEDVIPAVPMNIEPFVEAASSRATVSIPRSGDGIGVESATGFNNGRTLNENSTPTSVTPNSGLGISILKSKAKLPATQGRVMTSDLRDQLKKAQKKAGILTQRGQKVGTDGASSAPGLPAGSSTARPMPAVSSANSTAPRAPVPAPAISTSLAGPSSIPAQQNELSIDNLSAGHTHMGAGFYEQIDKDSALNEYLDACQSLKDKKLAYQARGGKDEVTEIELMIAQGDLDRKKRKLEEDKQYNEAEAPENDPLFESLANGFEALSNFNDSGSGQVFESELVQASPRVRKGKGGKGKVGRPAKSKNNNDEIKDQAAKVSKKAPKGKKGKRDDTRMLDMGSLFASNVIQAAQGNAGRAPLAVLDSTKRGLALKQLVASVPLEHRKMAQVDKTYLNRACQDFVGRAVKAVPGNDGWQIMGMTCVLKHHQLLGAAFMRRRERSNDNPHGGICADQMGLGKTIMTLANIVNGRPRNGEGPKTTLIVAPPALITQWMGEISKHTLQERKNKWVPLKVLKWHGSSKPVTNDRLGGIPDYDIVLTTYDEVRKSYPKEDYPIHLRTRQEREAWWQQYYEENKGTLHRVDYLRVVLDEAQAIKNHKSHTSIACRGLVATHRWALSGTPIQNAARELFPYFKFLQVEHTGTFKIFCQNFIGSHSDGSLSKIGLDRLHSFLSRFMIRRTHADQLMGAPIVSLPKASERIYWCQFNDLERAIYEMVRARMIQRINRLSRTKQLENSYSCILTMLLRLRQLTGHMLALEQPMKELLEKEDHEKIYDLAMEARLYPESSHVEKMRALRTELYRPGDEQGKGKHSAGMAGVRNEENEQDDDDRADSVLGLPGRRDCSYVGRQHGKKYDFMRYLEDLMSGSSARDADNRSACGYCNDIAEDPHRTQCYHVYCKKCLERMLENAAGRGLEGARCVVCQTVYTSTFPCDRMNFDRDRDLDDDSMDDYSDQELLRREPKKNKKKRPMFVEKAKDWIDLADGNDILPSTKTLAIKAQIINWLQENSSMKIIIYTQFMDMIRIISKVCSAEKWKYSTYHGGKSHEARDLAIQEFSENPDMRIMIASLRCGGIGLNLTMAQKVIVVDPWWNSSVEQQAFCRVFRIGQELETSMTRFVVEKTVDENMIRMQERKQKEIDNVMDNDQHRKLTIRELLRLFGDVDCDENGNEFILVSNRDTRPNPNGDMEDEGYDDD